MANCETLIDSPFFTVSGTKSSSELAGFDSVLANWDNLLARDLGWEVAAVGVVAAVPLCPGSLLDDGEVRAFLAGDIIFFLKK